MKVTDKIIITNEDIKLINGDCFLLNESIESETVDLIVTDPPLWYELSKWTQKTKTIRIKIQFQIISKTASSHNLASGR